MRQNRPTGLWIVALLGVLGAVGCARYQPRPLSAELGISAFDSRTLDDPGLRPLVAAHLDAAESDWPPSSWDFPRLVLAACYFHPDLDVARADWAVARAAQTTAGQRPNPTVGVEPSFNTTNATPSPWLVMATLDVPIETAGKRAHRQAGAASLAEVARLGVASRAWQVRARVRTALVGLETARARQALLRQQAALEGQTNQLLDARLAAGAVSAFEVTRARISEQRTLLALHDADAAAVVARARLAEAIGVPVAALDDVELSFAGLDEPPEVPSLPEARRLAALHRPDILASLADYAASEAALQLEIAKQYPDVHLRPGYEFDQGDDKWGIGLSIELPLLNQNQGPIAEAEAGRAAAAARFNALQARVLGDVEVAVAAYRVALEKLVLADTLRDDLERQEETAAAMQTAGAISQAELVGLRLELAASRLVRLDAVSTAQRALGELENAVQSPIVLPEALWQVSSRAETPE